MEDSVTPAVIASHNLVHPAAENPNMGVQSSDVQRSYSVDAG